MSVQARSALLDSDKAPGVVIDLLLAWHPALVSIDELALEVAGSATEQADARLFVQDGIAELLASGLAHSLKNFVFASRAAVDWPGCAS